MTGKERVQATLRHQKSDAIPIYFGGTSSWMTDEAYYNLCSYLGIQPAGKTYRHGHTGNIIDNRILEILDVDIRVLQMQIGLETTQIRDDVYLSDWGIPLLHKAGYGTRIEPPLADIDVESIQDNPEKILQVLNKHLWPDPFDPRRVLHLKQEAELLSQSGCSLVARSPQSASFIEYGCWLRGTSQFYMDLYLYPLFTNMLLDRILEIQQGFYRTLLNEIGGYVDIVETSEDYGTQSSLLISPEQFEQYIVPRRTALNRCIKTQCPHIRILHHSCGAIFPIIEKLIKSGVDILNPVQPIESVMDHRIIADMYGDRLVFCGGIDMQHALFGDDSVLRKEISKRIDILGTNHGYLISTSNHIQPDTPAKQIIHLFELIHELVSIGEQ